MIARLDSWCDVRDTAAYAVHHSAYEKFTSFLNRLRSLPAWLRHGSLDVPAIDNWLPHALPCVYVLPTLVSQPSTANNSQGATALLRQKSALGFMNVCVHARGRRRREERAPAWMESRHVGRTMKLSSFATRHLYVLKVQD